MTPEQAQYEEELERCKKGRKVQVLLLLEKNVRLTSSELYQLMNMKSPNLTQYTYRLEKAGLIEIYDGSKFKDPAEVNYKYKYHSLTEAGRNLLDGLGKQ